MQNKTGTPGQTLSVMDGVALIVGIVVGTGIFKTPSLVAANSENDMIFLLAWCAGGVVSLIGALCYAELATAYPHTGGDYHYLGRAFGQKVAFLFGWARMTVIQPGSIAMLAFVFGDYLSQLLPPVFTSSRCALFAVIALTIMNVVGTKQSTWTQNLLTAAKVIGLLSVLLAGMIVAPSLPQVEPSHQTHASFGLAMVFVLLTFGGWNEAAYISAELQEAKRSMIRVLLWGLGVITAIYLLAGFAYLRGLGLIGMGQSDVVAADLMRKAFGEMGGKFTSFLIAISALGAISATIFTGARTNYALGRDFALFKPLGQWKEKANAPANALLFQGIIASILVLLGALTRKGFETMVDFTAPVFWLFFLLTGISLIVLRIKEPGVARPFTVPFFPYLPLIFCASSTYMLQASLAYTGRGALAGVAVLLSGTLCLLLSRLIQRKLA